MGGIIAAVVLIVVAIGFSAWWKGRLIGQGKIIQRAKDFVEYAEIFTTRPIANEEYAAALKALDLKKTGTSLEGNTKAVKFTGIYFSASIRGIYFSASIRCVEQTETNSVYRFEFDSWKTKYGRPSFENEMNMLLTTVEKMFIQLDPNTQVSTVKNEITTKRSIF